MKYKSKMRAKLMALLIMSTGMATLTACGTSTYQTIVPEVGVMQTSRNPEIHEVYSPEINEAMQTLSATTEARTGVYPNLYSWQIDYAEILRDIQRDFALQHAAAVESGLTEEIDRLREISFKLVDIDFDGVPELWVHGYEIPRATRHTRIYRYNQATNSVEQIFDRIDSRALTWPSNDPNHMGIFFEDWNSESQLYFIPMTDGVIDNYWERHNRGAHLIGRTELGIHSQNETIFYTEDESLINALQNSVEHRWGSSISIEWGAIRASAGKLEMDIARVIYGVEVNENSHPFAMELQNIVDNLPHDHTFQSATLINLDRYGEQQGVVVLASFHRNVWQDPVTRRTHRTDPETQKTIIYMHDGQIRTDVAEHFWTRFLLTSYDMLYVRFGDGGETARTVASVQNGEMQRFSINTQGILPYEDLHIRISENLSNWRDMLTPGPWNSSNWERITSQRLRELERELGLDSIYDENSWNNATFVTDQTVQILAMQAPASTPSPAPSTPAPSANQINVSIGNVPVNFADQAPIIVNGSTLVPVRGVFEALGFDISWDERTRQVTLSRANDNIVITINSPNFIANRTRHNLAVPAQAIGGRTMLPIRDVLESVGYNLEWDAATNTINIIN